MIFFNKIKKQQLEAYQEKILKTHYAEVSNMYKQMRGYKHDFKSHIQVLKVYALNGDLDKISTYLDELDDSLQKIDTPVKTGNSIADAILNSKISLATSKNITVSIDANIPFKLSISEIDLCIVLGNLFDNAIEASLSLKEDDRLIRVYITIKNTQLYISFTNFTASKKQNKIGSIFKSTKGSNHGFGLMRIDDIVGKMNGYISRNSEDGAFTTEILLPFK